MRRLQSVVEHGCHTHSLEEAYRWRLGQRQARAEGGCRDLPSVHANLGR